MRSTIFTANTEPVSHQTLLREEQQRITRQQSPGLTREPRNKFFPYYELLRRIELRYVRQFKGPDGFHFNNGENLSSG